jgi:PIN domain nuclease of toxin-antitoxin system
VKLLLDTAVFLWHITGSEQLPADVVDAVRSPANDVRLSVVSMWEIQVKHGLGRLVLPESPATYIPRQRERHQIASIPLVESVLAHLANLPDRHRDPFDRMLICQAIEHDLTLVSSDRAIHAYPVRVLWTGSQIG